MIWKPVPVSTPILGKVRPTPVSARIRDWLLLAACNLIWASQFAMVKLVQDQMGPLFAVTLPMGIATLLLIPFVRGPHAGVTRADARRFVLIGVAGQVVAQLFITWGVRLSLAANAALLALALPVITAFIAHLLLSEKMTRVRWVSFGLALVGAAICSGIDWRELNLTGVRYAAGNALILASVCGSAFYNVYSKKLLLRYSPLQVLLYSYYVVCAVLLPITMAAEGHTIFAVPDFAWSVWIGLFILAVFQYFLSMVIFLNVLTRLDATQAALSNYLIPFFGLVLAAIILGERMTPEMVAGGAVVLLSTLLITAFEELPGIRGQRTARN